MSRHYSIKAASNLSGVAADTIRAWERRYAALEPHREESGRRVYTEGDIERLLLIRKACELGLPIRKAAKLSDLELREMGEKWRGEAGTGDQESAQQDDATIGKLIGAIERYEPEEFDRLLGCALLALTPDGLIQRVLFPLLRAVGDRWYAGSLSPAQEHMVSAKLRSLTGSLLQAYPRHAGAETICLATLAGERHEFGALLCCWLAAMRGWRCCYLGPDLPPEEIAKAAVAMGASVVALSQVRKADPDELAGLIKALREKLPEAIEIWIGGSGAAALAERPANGNGYRIGDIHGFMLRLESSGMAARRKPRAVGQEEAE